MRRNRACLLGLVLPASGLVGVARVAAQAQSQAAQPAVGVRQFSLELREVPLRVGLRAYLKDSPIRYQDQGSGTGGALIFDPNVPDPKITVSFRDVPFRLGLLLVVGAAREAEPGISYGRESSIYVIKYSPQRAEQEREAARKALRLKSETFEGTPLRDAVTRWMENRHGRGIVATEVPNVPVSLALDQLEVEAGLERIVAQARLQVPGLRLSRGGQTFAIHL